MGALAQQRFPFAKRFPDQPELTVLQIAQAAMDYSCRAAGYPGGKIVLLNQQRALAGARALPRYGNSVNAAANHHHLELLSFQGGSRISC